MSAGCARVYGRGGDEGNYAKSRSTRALIEEEEEPVMVRDMYAYVCLRACVRACVRVLGTCTALFIVLLRWDRFISVFVWLWLRTRMCHCHEFVGSTTTTLADNQVGDGGAKDFAKALEVNSSLLTLDLGCECCCCMPLPWVYSANRHYFL